MNKEKLAEKLEQLRQEQAHWLQQVEIAKANYHRVSGAIAVVENLVADLPPINPPPPQLEPTEEKKA